MFLVVTSNHNLKGPKFESPFPQLRKSANTLKNRTRKQGNHILGKWAEKEREETDLTGGNRKPETDSGEEHFSWRMGKESDFKKDEEQVKAESSRRMKLESQEE
ncbi:hypothetical protein PanWU01x14_247490 [Parasponia andersonii]|uniref:Uncharacterized protein n=1 Tax=Parasponia andersonii TaxID=3476 RepID=A0A2P5BDY0_PARAD|nr:hypothetical protein PanWU01x14_247490 [Parasponia andersonii]